MIYINIIIIIFNYNACYVSYHTITLCTLLHLLYFMTITHDIYYNK